MTDKSTTTRRRRHHSAETRERIRASHIAKREQTRADAIARTSDPTWRQRHREAMDAPDVRRRISERTKAAHEMPGMRERKLAGICAAYADPALHRKVSEATKQGMARRREAKLQALREAWRAADKRMRAAFLAEINLIGPSTHAA